jgi:hypothetical protein
MIGTTDRSTFASLNRAAKTGSGFSSRWQQQGFDIRWTSAEEWLSGNVCCD